MATGTASWQGATGVGGIYYKTAVGLVMRKTDNTEVTLGAGGGGSTLTTTYAAGASTADSIMALDATRGPVILTDASSTIGTLFTIRNSLATQNYLSINSNSNQLIKSGMADGASALALAVDTVSAWSNATAKLLRLNTNGTEKFSVLANGGLNVAANLVVTGAASSTNTVGMSHVANVADGASSVAHDFNNATTLANAAASLLRIRNNGTTLLTTLLNSSDGVSFKDGGGSSRLSLSSNTGAAMGFASSNVTVGSATVTATDGTGTLALASGNLTLTIFQGVPDADGTRDWGLVGTRWRTLGAKRIAPGLFVVTSSATPAFDPANGDKQRMILTANVTSWTFAAGLSGETVTIEFIQDGTGSRTLAGTPANVKLAGAALTLSTGINKRDLITFEYDLTDSNWYEQSRSLNC